MKKENKLYETKRGDFTIPLTVNGKIIRIRFIANGKLIGYYFSNSPEIQSAIEKHSAYGDLFYLSPSSVNDIAAPERVINHICIRHWQEGKELLSKTPHEVPMERLETPESIQEEGKKLNIEFVISENQ